jgi:hypothetical protein
MGVKTRAQNIHSRKKYLHWTDILIHKGWTWYNLLTLLIGKSVYVVRSVRLLSAQTTQAQVCNFDRSAQTTQAQVCKFDGYFNPWRGKKCEKCDVIVTGSK